VSDNDLTDEIKDITNRVFERQEFQHYDENREEILTRVLIDHAESIRVATAADRSAYDDETTSAARTASVCRKQTAFRLFALSLVGAVLLQTSIYLTIVPLSTLVNNSPSWIAGNQSTLVFLGWLAFVLSLVALLWQWVRRRAALQAIEAPALAAKSNLERAMDAAVQEAVSTAINTELGPKGIIAFPTHAPRLVEFDAAEIRPSATTAYVKEFILQHESSAIGLAGTRGSGKSTVMRALKADKDLKDQDLKDQVVIVPSPVRYDAGEFIRLLLAEIATHLSEGHRRGATTRLRGLFKRIKASTLAIIMLSSMVVFLILIVQDLGGAAPSWVSLFDYLPLLPLGLSVLICLAALVGKTLLRMDGEALPPDVRRARELLRELRWETEHGATAKSMMKVKSLFEAGGERSLKLKSRAMGRSELVGALRDLLKTFASRTDPTRMVVCVDELDKISDPDHLVEIVNELKDLFHIQKVHFLVTVSTDALDSFEQRGLAGRDVFDSAFDTVVHTRWLTLDESLDVVKARATGFPPIVAMLCHAWSGGLARDLLRAARAAVELQRRDPRQPLSVAEIVTDLVLDDLDRAVRASMRSLAADDKQLDDLWALQQALTTARVFKSATSDVTNKIETVSFEMPALQALHAKVRLGLSILGVAQAATSLPNYWVEDGKAIRNLRQAAINHAAAIRVLGEPIPVHESAVQKAIGQFDPAALGP
jgi:hypothetical protein